MSVSITPGFTLSEGTFSLFIASGDHLHRALSGILRRQRGRTLYVCGNYPVLLTRFQEYAASFEVRRALTAYQVLTILDEAHHSLLLFEHDPTLYDDITDLPCIIGQKCREYAATTGTVLLFASQPDRPLNLFEPYAHRVGVYQGEIIPRVKPVKKREARQKTLEGLW
ncbi:MAG: hypothetical protein JXA44_13085 [Methanospirillaceae archaeon]|nr:hypothetical protein [Methanospirillaceae archaeon]